MFMHQSKLKSGFVRIDAHVVPPGSICMAGLRLHCIADGRARRAMHTPSRPRGRLRGHSRGQSPMPGRGHPGRLRPGGRRWHLCSSGYPQASCPCLRCRPPLPLLSICLLRPSQDCLDVGWSRSAWSWPAGGSDGEENDDEVEPADDDREFMRLLGDEIEKVTSFYTSKVRGPAMTFYQNFRTFLCFGGNVTLPVICMRKSEKSLPDGVQDAAAIAIEKDDWHRDA